MAATATREKNHDTTDRDETGDAPILAEGGVDALRRSAMMAHLLDSLGRGEDIGHYGRLVFVMVARHFLPEDDLVARLSHDRDFGEEEARSLVAQVAAHDYSPPRREKVLEFQSRQEFAFVPDPEDPDAGNVYRDLQFPERVYAHIQDYYEHKNHG